MDTLNSRNKFDFEFPILFIKETHKYRTEDGVEAKYSVTEFKKTLGNFEFDMDMIANRLSRVTKNPTSEYHNKTPGQVKDIFNRKALFGEKLHYCIENYLNKRNLRLMDKEERIELIHAQLGDNSAFVDVLPHLTKFIEYEEKSLYARGLIPHRVEMAIFFKPFRIAGTIDAIYRSCKGNGKYVVIDWKTVSNEASLQRKATPPNLYFPLNHLASTKMMGYCIQINIYVYILKYYGVDMDEDNNMLVFFNTTKQTVSDFKVPNLQPEMKTLFAMVEHDENTSKEIENWEKTGMELKHFPKSPKPIV